MAAPAPSPAPAPAPAPAAAPTPAASNFPLLSRTSIHLDSLLQPPPTTDFSTSSPGTLSPRALEKQPTRHADIPHSTVTANPELFPASPPVDRPPFAFSYPAPGPSYQPPVTHHDPPLSTLAHPPPPAQRRSFLEALLVRQKKVIAPDNRSAASRVLNPINYVPRPTRVRVQAHHQHQRQASSADAVTGEVRTLLNLPEQRRSRQHSPTDYTVEHTTHATPQPGDRTSIALPTNQQRTQLTNYLSPQAGLMNDPEKHEVPGLQEPDRAHLPPTHNARARDLEPQQASSVLGQSYGVSPLDEPLQPPRRITSHRSLNRAQSGMSLRSSAYAKTNPDGGLAPPGSHDDDQRPYTEDDDDESIGDELAWGPSHPCFPHLNPHVPLDSPEYTATRIIRVRRDWMVVGDLAPTFSNIYPEILDPLMQEQEFRYVIEHINHTLCTAYDPFSTWNWLDGLLGLATGWFWEDVRPFGVKGRLRALEEWLEDWNHTVGARNGVRIIPLRRTGYLNLDVQIPDPQVTMVAERDDDNQAPQEVNSGQANTQAM